MEITFIIVNTFNVQVCLNECHFAAYTLHFICNRKCEEESFCSSKLSCPGNSLDTSSNGGYMCREIVRGDEKCQSGSAFLTMGLNILMIAKYTITYICNVRIHKKSKIIM